jgi:hypothetical protein
MPAVAGKKAFGIGLLGDSAGDAIIDIAGALAFFYLMNSCSLKSLWRVKKIEWQALDK